MTRAHRTACALLLAMAAMLAIASLSRVRPPEPAAAEAVLRLSWRTRGERVEECRRPSEQELASLPVHMRREEVCEGRVLPYHLRVELDGRTVVDDTVRPAGARGDRPLYVYHEVPVQPGSHHLAVRFVRAGDHHARGHAPRRLELEKAVGVGAGEVALVTYDVDRQELVLRRPEASAPPTPAGGGR